MADNQPDGFAEAQARNTRCRRCGGLLEMRVDPDQMVCPPQDILDLVESSSQQRRDEMASDPARVLERLREHMDRSRSENVHPLKRLLLRLRRMLKGPSPAGHFGYARFKGDMFCRNMWGEVGWRKSSLCLAAERPHEPMRWLSLRCLSPSPSSPAGRGRRYGPRRRSLCRGHSLASGLPCCEADRSRALCSLSRHLSRTGSNQSQPLCSTLAPPRYSVLTRRRGRASYLTLTLMIET